MGKDSARTRLGAAVGLEIAGEVGMRLRKKPEQRQAKRYMRARYDGKTLRVLSRLLQLASMHGLRVIVSDRRRYQWDGKGCICLTPVQGTSLAICDLAHEIAHWILATPAMRQMADYGLGESPDSNCLAEATFDTSRCAWEEEQASIFGMILETWAGADPSFTWHHHGWEDWKPDALLRQAWTHARALRRLGLISGCAVMRSRALPEETLEVDGQSWRYCPVVWGRDLFRGWRIAACETLERRA